jgi:hypothetical protein
MAYRKIIMEPFWHITCKQKKTTSCSKLQQMLTVK